MAHRIINTPEQMADFVNFVQRLDLPVTFEWTKGRDRSLEQNRLQFLWAREAAEQWGDRTPDEVRCDWKLRHGVPILREASPEFRDTFDRIIRPLPYQGRLMAMQLIEVTSLMKVRQMVRYLDTVERECREQGIRLTDPDPEMKSYMARYRAPEGKAA